MDFGGNRTTTITMESGSATAQTVINEDADTVGASHYLEWTYTAASGGSSGYLTCTSGTALPTRVQLGNWRR